MIRKAMATWEVVWATFNQCRLRDYNLAIQLAAAVG